MPESVGNCTIKRKEFCHIWNRSNDTFGIRTIKQIYLKRKDMFTCSIIELSCNTAIPAFMVDDP